MPPISTIISKPQTDNDDDDDDEKEEANQTYLQLSESNFTDNLLAPFLQLLIYNFYLLTIFVCYFFGPKKISSKAACKMLVKLST